MPNFETGSLTHLEHDLLAAVPNLRELLTEDQFTDLVSNAFNWHLSRNRVVAERDEQGRLFEGEA